MSKVFRIRLEFDIAVPGNPRTPPAWAKRFKGKLEDAIEHAFEHEVKTAATASTVRISHSVLRTE